MIEISPIPAFQDNYIWLIHDDKKNAIVVDPGDANSVLDTCQKQQITLKAILLTHHHPDHCAGIPTLLQHDNIPVYASNKMKASYITHALMADESFYIDTLALSFNTLDVPGHTLDHIAFYQPETNALFCGDTLFSVGCGRLFEGSAEQMLTSLNKLKNLPDMTQIFCAHEYTLANIQFAKTIEKDHLPLLNHEKHVNFLRKQSLPSLPTTLAKEKQINPFLRCALTSLQQAVSEKSGINCTGELSTFTQLRQLKDHF